MMEETTTELAVAEENGTKAVAGPRQKLAELEQQAREKFRLAYVELCQEHGYQIEATPRAAINGNGLLVVAGVSYDVVPYVAPR